MSVFCVGYRCATRPCYKFQMGIAFGEDLEQRKGFEYNDHATEMK